MTELEATQRAVMELGQQATAAQIARYASESWGVHLDVRFVPLYVATLRGNAYREQMRAMAAQSEASAK